MADTSVEFVPVSSGVQRGDSPFGGGTGGAPQNPLSPFQKRKGERGWFGVWRITSASPTRGRSHDGVFRCQVLVATINRRR